MRSLTAQWTLRQCAVFCTFILLCSLGAFLVHNNLDFTFNSELFKVTLKQEVSANIQGNDTQVQALVTEGHRKQELINAREGHTDPQTIIMIWMWPFGYRFGISCGTIDMKGCHLTDDRTLYSKAHVVLFHHRDIRQDLSNMPKEPRPWFQKWVWWNKESPANTSPIPQANNLFNLTCNYRLDSTVPGPYGLLAKLKHAEDFKMPTKDKLVCWIVSNWNENFKRVQFYNELKKHIKIEVYGKPFGNSITVQEAAKVISSCKFYLSFENSIYKDYITEKLYNPMSVGTVPIVLGPSRQNYEEHIPGDSFIHFEDFDTPKMLADKLHYLDQNQKEYLSYFTWRRDFKVQKRQFSLDICYICKYLKHARGYEVIKGLNQWFWG